MAALALLLPACTTANTAATDEGGDWFCLAFRPIYWSSDDTTRTREQITEHNAAWEAVCGEG